MPTPRPSVSQLRHLLAVARGEASPDLVIRGARVFLAHTREWVEGDVAVAGGRIAGVGGTYPNPAATVDAAGSYLVPGFVDAHVHVESSKLVPWEFARAVVAHGTTTVVAEPHEIANVLGAAGVDWMLQAAEGAPVDIFAMAPSCVPASQFESPGGVFGHAEIERMLAHPRCLGVGEMMNFPGTLGGDPSELGKTVLAGTMHVDGHAPGVAGPQLDAYRAAGIGSDHECTTVGEATEKLRRGMWVFLRDASNARNLVDLIPLIDRFGTNHMALCTDDREPDMLLEDGHINHMVRQCVERGVQVEDALVLATLNPALAHGLTDRGAIVPGARADLQLLANLEDFRPSSVWKDGVLVARAGEALVSARVREEAAPAAVRDTVRIAPLAASDFEITVAGRDGDEVEVRVIGALEGQLLTRDLTLTAVVQGGVAQPDPARDLARLAVVERHVASGRIGNGFVTGFGLTRGAFGTSVSHDAHNLIVAGIAGGDMAACAQRLAQIGGGVVVVDDGTVVAELPLPVAGLMSDMPVERVAAGLGAVQDALGGLGVEVEAPLMILSFLGLSVIPDLKLTDRGLVDVQAFSLTPVVVGEPATAAV